MSRGRRLRPGAAPAVVVLFTIAHALDALDGALARHFGQCSKFGEVFDVFIDNVGRTLTWVVAVHSSARAPLAGVLGVLAIALEWTTFVCSHAGTMRTQPSGPAVW